MERTVEIFNELYEIVLGQWPGISVDLEVDKKGFKQFRQVAFALQDGDYLAIVVSPKIESMSDEVITGVLAHELGHIIDFAVGNSMLRNKYGMLPHTPELRADAIAEAAFDVEISYDENDIETIGPGVRPRPKHLGL